MTNIYEQLLRLNVELEGALRVLRERDSYQALQVATEKFETMSSLFQSLKERAAANTPTEIKEEEAVGAEQAPLNEPAQKSVPDNAVIADSDASSIEAAVDEASKSAKESEEDPIEAKVSNITIPQTVGDIRKSMTLNDKFLFRRELFGGNDAELNDTLELLASMHSFDEAEEYIYDDLQWNREDPTVSDFMSIIKTIFTNYGKA